MLMSDIPVQEDVLISRITMEAKLKTRISFVKQRLDFYPSLILQNYGTSLKYRLRGKDLEDHFYELELSNDAILLSIYSKIHSPMYFMQEAMLRLLSICAVIEDIYQFEISSLFPYLITLLAGQQLNYYLKNEFSYESRGENVSDIILARRITSLIKENLELKKKLDSSVRKSVSSLSALIVLKYSSNASAMEIARENGVDKEDVETALRSMPDIGYRVMNEGKGIFSIVKL